MTFSIVARSADGASFGIAVASKFLAVGAAVPGAEAEIGAIATQSYANLAYRPQGLALLRTGTSAAGTVAGLTAADPGRASRQLGVVGADGPGATYTGTDCHPWAGGVAGDGYAIQGNILTGPEVVDAMEKAWLTSGADPGQSLARRLLTALTAGDLAGGDRRGRQSAALYVVRKGGGYAGTSDIAVDVRVDDAVEPIPELARLLDLHEMFFNRPDPGVLLPLEGELAQEVQQRLAKLGYSDLAEWAGVENLEERIVADGLDPVVLQYLRAVSGS